MRLAALIAGTVLLRATVVSGGPLYYWNMGIGAVGFALVITAMLTKGRE